MLLNSLVWFGDGERQQVSFDRQSGPAAYWLIAVEAYALRGFLARSF